MKIVNPATALVIGEIVDTRSSDVAIAVAKARSAQPDWADLLVAERVEVLTRFKDLLGANHERLARTLSQEMGKPLKQAKNELNAMPGRIDFFLENTANAIAAEKVYDEGGMVEYVRYEPLGVVANISAWNYPYFVGSNVFVPALLCGNTVLYKPSEIATLTGISIAELLWEAGVPRDVFQVLPGDGAIGSAILEAPIDGVFFTGSLPTGRKIASAVASRMVRVQLELGGKDPTYVCEDVDPKAAAESLSDGAMYNAGQSCCSVERIYVHEAIAPQFIEAFVECVKGFVVGEPENEATYIGPLARPAQVAVLEAQVADAVGKGAKLLVGGKRHALGGSYFEPTVLTHVNHTMAVMREESFGPIIGIQVVKSDDEAIALMNDTDYGLTAGIYTKDEARARNVLEQVNAGSVYWNCCDRVSPRLPWTGRRGSGIGSTLGVLGIRAFVQPKAWHERR
ncbi:MAG: aldehyde dehydrogenase family protein [Polyangiaceae bacterium]